MRYHWTDDPRWLLYLQDDGGDENWHVFRVDLDDPEAPAVDLTPFPGATTLGPDLPPDRPGRAILRLNARTPAEFDLYELDIATGELTLLAESPAAGSGWELAGDTLLRGALTADGTTELWNGEERVATFDGDAYPVGVFPYETTPDGTGIWFGSYRGGDQLHLARLDLHSGEEIEVDRHPPTTSTPGPRCSPACPRR